MDEFEFTERELMKAGRWYHRGTADQQENDYRDLVLSRKAADPPDRLGDAIPFLSWNALRPIGGDEVMRVLKGGWLRANSRTLKVLRGRAFTELDWSELQRAKNLYASLREEGIPPTASGKLLHFFLPDTLLLWDARWVRGGYDLDSDTDSYLRYQCFGQRLLRHVSDGNADRLEAIRQRHNDDAGYDEPLTKLVDEMSYHTYPERAYHALGGWDKAFALKASLRP